MVVLGLLEDSRSWDSSWYLEEGRERTEEKGKEKGGSGGG